MVCDGRIGGSGFTPKTYTPNLNRNQIFTWKRVKCLLWTFIWKINQKDYDSKCFVSQNITATVTYFLENVMCWFLYVYLFQQDFLKLRCNNNTTPFRRGLFGKCTWKKYWSFGKSIVPLSIKGGLFWRAHLVFILVGLSVNCIVLFRHLYKMFFIEVSLIYSLY